MVIRIRKVLANRNKLYKENFKPSGCSIAMQLVRVHLIVKITSGTNTYLRMNIMKPVRCHKELFQLEPAPGSYGAINLCLTDCY